MSVEVWRRIRGQLLESLGRDACRNWIDPIEFLEVRDGTAFLLTPTDFVSDWVRRNYAEPIRAAIQAEGLAVERLSFQARGALGDTVSGGDDGSTNGHGTESDTETVLARPSASGSGGGGLPGAPLDQCFTFNRFVVGKPNELAYAAARNVAGSDTVTFNPLFLYGGVGLGKTHLMHAIAWDIQERNPYANILYLSAEQFMYRFIQALRSNDTMNFKELFRSVDVLLVDDVQFIAGKESTQEEFFHTFNSLVDQKRKIVISADRSPGEIDGLGERIRTRLQSGLVVDVHPTDFELRLGVLQAKAEVLCRDNADIHVADGVLEFLARRISTNVRVLEGALHRLFAFALFIGREVTLEMAQDCLSDILRASSRKISIDEIIRKTAEHYNIRMADFLSPRRARSIVRPRQIAMYLAKQLTTKSLPEIGRNFGGRDHTTVLHAIRRIEELRSVDHHVAEDLELLRRSLEA